MLPGYGLHYQALNVEDSQCNHVDFNGLHCLDGENLFNLYHFSSIFTLKSLQMHNCNKNWCLIPHFKPPLIENLHMYQQGLVYDLYSSCKVVRILPTVRNEPPASDMLVDRRTSILCPAGLVIKMNWHRWAADPSPHRREEIAIRMAILLLLHAFSELCIKAQPNPCSWFWRIIYKIQ